MANTAHLHGKFGILQTFDLIILLCKDISQLNLHVDDKGVNVFFFSTLNGTKFHPEDGWSN